VLLEAMACGTPVIATNIWGTPEVVSTPSAGLLMEKRDAPSLSAAYEALLNVGPVRELTRAHAATFSWDETTAGQLSLFQNGASGNGQA
jgi:glycosyltransferase involved in cell wall biosynthesis